MSAKRQSPRRLCEDTPDGIPHLVDRPRATRCDQHREERRKWSNANSWRDGHGKPKLPWEPSPLESERRRQALDMFVNKNAEEILRSARLIQATVDSLKQVRSGLPTAHREYFDVGIARIEALVRSLMDTAIAMGLLPRTPDL